MEKLIKKSKNQKILIKNLLNLKKNRVIVKNLSVLKNIVNVIMLIKDVINHANVRIVKILVIEILLEMINHQ
jgi:hypothetical protein